MNNFNPSDLEYIQKLYGNSSHQQQRPPMNQQQQRPPMSQQQYQQMQQQQRPSMNQVSPENQFRQNLNNKPVNNTNTNSNSNNPSKDEYGRILQPRTIDKNEKDFGLGTLDSYEKMSGYGFSISKGSSLDVFNMGLCGNPLAVNKNLNVPDN